MHIEKGITNVKKTDVKNTPDKNKNSTLFSRKKGNKVGDNTFKKLIEKELEK